MDPETRVLSIMQRIGGSVKFILLSVAITFLGTSKSVGQNDLSTEQVTLNFFMQTIFCSKYPEVKVLGFAGSTAGKASSFNVTNRCFSNEPGLESEVDEAARSQVCLKKSLRVSASGSVKLKKGRSRYTLMVFDATILENRKYVEVQVEEDHTGWERYYFELDHNNNVIRWCNTGVVW